MTTPTQNQNQGKNQDQRKDSQATGQNRQDQAQGRKDDLHNTGAQAKTGQDAKDADRDVQQRKDAPKQGQDH